MKPAAALLAAMHEDTADGTDPDHGPARRTGRSAAGGECAGAVAAAGTAAFTQAVPDGRRGQTIGLASAGLQTAQGLGVLAAGALAEVLPPSVAVAVCGAAGSACALLAARAWRHAQAAS